MDSVFAFAGRAALAPESTRPILADLGQVLEADEVNTDTLVGAIARFTAWQQESLTTARIEPADAAAPPALDRIADELRSGLDTLRAEVERLRQKLDKE